MVGQRVFVVTSTYENETQIVGVFSKEEQANKEAAEAAIEQLDALCDVEGIEEATVKIKALYENGLYDSVLEKCNSLQHQEDYNGNDDPCIIEVFAREIQ